MKYTNNLYKHKQMKIRVFSKSPNSLIIIIFCYQRKKGLYNLILISKPKTTRQCAARKTQKLFAKFQNVKIKSTKLQLNCKWFLVSVKK